LFSFYAIQSSDTYFTEKLLLLDGNEALLDELEHREERNDHLDPVLCVSDDLVKGGFYSLGERLLQMRFYEGEEKNDEEFAKKLAEPFDMYVNEAFSVCHRSHASVDAITRHLPSFAGLRLMEEIQELDNVRLSPEHPAVAIIGGAKIETKLPLIKALEKNFDAILVGGKVANEAIDQNIPFSDKVLLPKDFDSAMRLDIGPQTIGYFTQIICQAKTVIWNGPMGKFEEKPYDMGTNAILHALLESEAYVVIGGGESLAVLEKADVIDKVSFVSSGGGAMLEYLSDKALPGLIALEKNEGSGEPRTGEDVSNA